MKKLRQAKNWTQQHLAEVCSLSMRTIQRVEKDGVASNETVGAYAAVFELNVSDILISTETYEQLNRVAVASQKSPILMSLLFVGGFAAGVGTTLWLF